VHCSEQWSGGTSPQSRRVWGGTGDYTPSLAGRTADNTEGRKQLPLARAPGTFSKIINIIKFIKFSGLGSEEAGRVLDNYRVPVIIGP
jgi:hypothetical protein